MKRVILVITLLLSSVCHAQTDTVFWFAAPDLSSRYGETPIRLVFHAYDQPATITVSQPANSFYPTSSFNMPAHGTVSYDLSLMVSLIETTPRDTILNRGFYIHSTAPITCYYQSTSANRETYTLKGRKALGTDFQILSPIYSRYLAPNLLGYGPSVEMIASEDSTLVTVTLSKWSLSHNWDSDTLIGSDSTFQIRLNRGQSYAVGTDLYYRDLSKTKIHATHPIAVNITSDAVMSRNPMGGPYHYNLAGEQLLPLSYWGTRYIRINQQTITEMFRATDFYDTGGLYATYVNGRATGFNSSGMVWNVGWPNFHDSAHFVESELPLGMVHQLDPNLQMGFTILPQIECAGSNKIAYLRSGDLPLTIHLIVESHAIGDILLNNDSTLITAACFSPIPGALSYAWCNMDVSSLVPPDSTMRISCSTSKFILGIIESDSNRGTSYTILTDYSPAPFIKIRKDMDTTYCQGDSIAFHYQAYNIDSIAIHGPNGLLLDHPPYTIAHADTSMSGLYTIEAFTYGDCHLLRTDSIRLSIGPNRHASVTDTIVESQLPWRFLGNLLYGETDTLFFIPIPGSHCDSIIRYHLYVWRNLEDTVLYYACESELPVQYGDSLFYQEGEGTFRFTGSHGEDSLVTFILHVIPSSDTTIRDSITENQLPWFAMDTVFNDTVADYIYHLYNEAGCDSIIHYSLFVFWNGDHCDTALSYPNVVTPNGDGVNDRFVIGGLIEHNCFRYNELTIYDRYGHCVYHKRNIATEADWWDPATQRAPAGTYFYYFKAHGVNIWTQHRGVIEVLRN